MKRLQLKSDNCLSHNHAQAQESKNGSTSKRKFYNQPNYHNPTPSRSKGMTIETLERLARTDFLSPGGNPDEVLQTTFTNFLRRSDIPTARETDLAESDASAKIKIGMRLGTAALALEVVQKTCYMARMKRDRERKMEQLAEKEKERAEKDGKTRFIGRKWKTPTKPRRTDPGEGKAQESAKRAAAVVLEHWESSLIPWIDFLVDEATGLAEGYSDEECPSTCIRVCAHVLFTLLRLLDDELVLEALDRPSTILLVIKIWTYVVPVTASNSGSEGGSVGKDEDEDKRSDGDSDGSSDDDSTLEEQEYIVMLDPCLCNDEDSVQTCPILGLFELCCGHPSRTKLFLSKAWEFMPSFTPYVLVDTLLQRLDVLVEIHSELGNTEPAMLYLEYMASVTHQILYTSDRVAKILYQDQFILRFADTLHSLLQNEGKDACVSTWEVAVHILMDFISWTQDYCIWRIKGRPHYFLDPVRQVQELLDGNLFLVLMRALEHLKPETKYYNMALSGIALVGSYSLYPRVLDVVSIDMDEHMGKDNLDRVFAKSDFAKVVVGSFIRSWLHGVDRQDCEDGSHYRCNNLTHHETQRDSSSRQDLATIQSCSCHSALYCSRACQVEDWKTFHRGECKAAALDYQIRRRSLSWVSNSARNHHYTMIEAMSNGAVYDALKKKLVLESRHEMVTIIDTGSTPIGLDRIKIGDYRRDNLPRFPEHSRPRCEAFLEGQGEKKMIYLMEVQFMFGREQISTLARMQYFPDNPKGDKFVFLNAVTRFSLPDECPTSDPSKCSLSCRKRHSSS